MGKKSGVYTDSDSDLSATSSSSESLPKRSKLSSLIAKLLNHEAISKPHLPAMDSSDIKQNVLFAVASKIVNFRAHNLPSAVSIRNYMKNKFRSKSLAVEKTNSSTPPSPQSLRVRYELSTITNKDARAFTMGKKSGVYTDSDSDLSATSSSSESLTKGSKLSAVNVKNYMKNKLKNKSLAVEKTNSSTLPSPQSLRVRYELSTITNKDARASSEDSDMDECPMYPMSTPAPPACKPYKYFLGTVPGSHSGPNGMSGGMVLYVRGNTYGPSRKDGEYNMRSAPPPTKETKKRFSLQTLEEKAHSIFVGIGKRLFEDAKDKSMSGQI